MTGMGGVGGRRLLVVEDEYLLADAIARGLEDRGAEVVGPVADIDDALDLIEAAGRLDGAVVDMNLRGEMAYPIADALIERGIPFVFTTGYDISHIPPRYADVAWCQKPVNASKLVDALFG